MKINLKNVRLKKRYLLIFMRTLVFFCCFTVFGLSPGSILSQNIKIETDTIVSVDEVFDMIGEQTDYKFIYPEDLFKNTSKVHLKKGEIKVNDLLNECITSNNLSFSFSGENAIVVSQTKVTAQQEEYQLNGIVKDPKGEPLPGVSVIVRSKKRGDITRMDGSFHILVDKDDILTFSYLGYKNIDVPVKGQKSIVIQMQESNVELDEVVVLGEASSGYAKIPKERATGSYGLISEKEIEETPALNLMERLQGKVPGVRFDISNNKVQIRGTNTYGLGDSGPLIVIDGFPAIDQNLTDVTNTTAKGNAVLSNFTSQDIENITFLKDAAAASIWGSRAANGVIVITTKKGKKEKKPTFSLSSTVSFSEKADLSQLNQMSSAEYVGFEQELFDKGFIYDPSSYKWNYNPSEGINWMLEAQRGNVTETQRDSALAVLSSRDNKKQINKYLLQSAITRQSNLSISGGAENSMYYISGTFAKDVPVYKSNEAKRFSITANLTNKFLNNNLELQTGIYYGNSKSKNNTTATDLLGVSQLGLRPYDLIADSNNNGIDRVVLYQPSVTSEYTSQGYLPWTYNAIDQLSMSNTESNEDDVRLNVSLSAKVTPWLKATVSGMYQKKISDTRNLDELYSYNTRVLLNTFTTVNNGNLEYAIPLGGILNLNNAKSHNYNLRGQLDINKTWKGIHNLNALAGAEIREVYSQSYGNKLYGFDEDTNQSQSINPTVYNSTVFGWSQKIGASNTSLSENKNRYQSYYGNASYAYKNTYVLTGSLRFDDYTLLGISRKDRIIPLWSLGGKWNMKNESFLKDVDWINNLSPRITYGTGGNVPTSGTVVPVISLPGNDNITDEPYATITTAANQNLGWETTKTYNFGLDYSFFNNRLLGSIEYYTKKTYDILVNLPYNATYGWSYLTFNAGTLKGNGVDLGITGKIIRSKNFEWSSTFNFSYNTNEVTDSRFENTTISAVNSSSPFVGYPLDYVLSYKWAGLDNTGQSQIYDKNGDIVSSTTGNADLSKEDLVYSGRKSAPYYGGFFNSFSYKGLKLDVQMSYAVGHVFRKQSINNYPTYVGFYYGTIGRQSDLADRWRESGDELITDVPGISNVSSNSINRYKYSDLLVRSASNVRLQQVSLSYSIPQKYLNNIFTSLNVTAAARNLGFVWRKNNEGIDPDYVSTSNYADLPPTRNFVFGVSATF